MKENLFYMYLQFCLPFTHYIKRQGKEISSRAIVFCTYFILTFILYDFLLKYFEQCNLRTKVGIDKHNKALFAGRNIG